MTFRRHRADHHSIIGNLVSSFSPMRTAYEHLDRDNNSEARQCRRAKYHERPRNFGSIIVGGPDPTTESRSGQRSFGSMPICRQTPIRHSHIKEVVELSSYNFGTKPTINYPHRLDSKHLG